MISLNAPHPHVANLTGHFFIHILPKAILILFLFFMFIIHLVSLFLKYCLIIPLVVPRMAVSSGSEFPAITVCTPAMRSQWSGDSLDTILHHHTIQYDEIIVICNLVQQNDPLDYKRMLCKDHLNISVVESLLHGGTRKCFTFRDWKTTHEDLFLLLALNISRMNGEGSENPVAYRDTAFTVHPWSYLPHVSESELVPLQVGMMNIVTFERLAAHIDSTSFGAHCTNYNDQSKIRSEYDCFNTCVLSRVYNLSQCLDRESAISEPFVSYMTNAPLASNATLCPGDTLHFYLSKMAKEECTELCPRDCNSMNYDVKYTVYNTSLWGLLVEGTSFISLNPSPQSYVVVYVEVMINLTNMIAYLGGNMHFWLGISIVYLFDYAVLCFNWIFNRQQQQQQQRQFSFFLKS